MVIHRGELDSDLFTRNCVNFCKSQKYSKRTHRTPQKIIIEKAEGNRNEAHYLLPIFTTTTTMALHKKLLALCGFLAGGLTTFTAAFDVDDLDAAILQDILESYTEHVPSTCTGDAASSTSFTYDFPGTNPDSEWYPSFVNFEQDLFLAEMTHTDDNNNTWIIRIGQGGNIYSHFCPDLHGESMPPQAHVDAPWIDEVFQSVSVNNDLNKREGMCNDDTCPAYYIHGAGTYQQDAPDTNVPFYSPSLAKHCDKNTCTFAAWGQQAHVATIFTSPVITLNRYTNCGDGVIEHTEMIHK